MSIGSHSKEKVRKVVRCPVNMDDCRTLAERPSVQTFDTPCGAKTADSTKHTAHSLMTSP